MSNPKKGDRVRIKPQYQRRYPERLGVGKVTQSTHLGIAIKVKWDRGSVGEWIDMTHLETI